MSDAPKSITFPDEAEIEGVRVRRGDAVAIRPSTREVIVTPCHERVEALERQRDRALAMFDGLRREHTGFTEDTEWAPCVLGNCAPECGAEEHNARVDALAAVLRGHDATGKDGGR